MPRKTTKKSSGKNARRTYRRKGGSKSKTAKKLASPKANTKELREKGLHQVKASEIIPCTNNKHGCNLKRFKRFACYKEIKTSKHTTKPDSIYLKPKGKGTQNLDKGIIKVFDKWFDCSHFDDE
jgi:hypothetical protein